MVGVRLDVVVPCCTVTRNAGSVAVARPSDTDTSRSPVVPTSEAVGVPLNSPDAASNCIQFGRPVMLNVSVSPSASEAVGRKTYRTPTSTD